MMFSTLLVGSVVGASTTAAPTTTPATTTAPVTTTAPGSTTAKDQWNVQCANSSGTDWCIAAQDLWAHCTCTGDKLSCPGKEGSKCLPGGQYDCKCANGPAPEKCTAEWNMGCDAGEPGFVPCCKGLQCIKNQCKAADPDTPSDNPYQPQQISEQGWHVGCISEISKKEGLTQFFYVKGDKLVDGAKVDIKQFIKGAEGATDLALGICSKECTADSDCPDVKGTTNKCLEVGSAGSKICASTETCISGMIQADKMCVSMNPFHYGKNLLNFKTYFPVPNFTHAGYHSQQWDMAKALESYRPLHLSNWISGIHLGQMIKKTWNWPLDGGKIKKEYIYGTLIGQLFQESAPSTNPKDIDNNIISPDPLLLNVGQGGPYQLNDYSKQLPPGTEGAHGMVNFNALYHALGYTVEAQNSDGPGSQTKHRGPKMLNSVNQGPMVAAYFHFNDIARYDIIQHQSYNIKKQDAKDWELCKANIESGKFPFPGMILNVIYNAGPFNDFAKMHFEICADVEKHPEALKDLVDYSLDDDAYVAKFKDMRHHPTAGTTYIIYPRQINYYIDQFCNDNEALYERNGAFSDIDVPFTLQNAVDEVKKVYTGLGYGNKEGIYTLIDEAFITKNQPSGADLTKQMTFSKKAYRETFFTFIEQWIENMEKAEGFKFSDATECNQKVGEKVVTECTPPAPTCNSSFPATWKNLCQCVEDKETKKMVMSCTGGESQVEKFEKEFACTCDKPTGTTTAAPAPQQGESCAAQNCAEGLGCLSDVWVDGKQVYSQMRYGNEGAKCLPFDQDPMISHLSSSTSGSVKDGESCKASKDCDKDSVCVANGVYMSSGQGVAECRSSADSNCKCAKAADSTCALVKVYLAQHKRSLAIIV